ncbi:hypothetical protein OG883_35460 [Streptomyces sp. NBC_01142]|uniref:hypothetical protein n=1 Tax=Streptomyces sp. NBC_01142 TaxID=2975865 RepID=UPI00225990EC|nr:hypothetical protein [Streptomyces sp. NBC_01142]MCX4825069.1 hypothetical protein [Streptomyces sp. NBC_01142]
MLHILLGERRRRGDRGGAGRAGPDINPEAPEAARERLTTLVEGLGERRLSSSPSPERALELLSGAFAVELVDLGER